jgi:hypothetical protein
MKVKFSGQIFGKAQLYNLIKIRPVGAELFHADGRNDGRDGANSCFSQFCESA